MITLFSCPFKLKFCLSLGSHIVLLTTDDKLHMYNVAEPFERLRMQQEEEDGNDDTAYKPIPEFEYDLFKSSGHSEDKEERLVLLCSVLVGSLSIHFFRCL